MSTTNNGGFRHKLFRDIREGMFPSQRKFAIALREEAGVDIKQSHISAIERGVALPSVQALIGMAKVLQVNPAYLLGFTNDDMMPADQEEQVIVKVVDPRRRTQLYDMARQMVDLPEADFLLVHGMVNRLARNHVKVRRRTTVVSEEQKREELKSEIRSFLDSIRTWGGIEFSTEVASDITNAAMAASETEFSDHLDTLRQYTQSVRERLQASSGRLIERSR